MATTSTPDTGELRLVLDDILVGDDVRDIDQEHVENRAVDCAARAARPAHRPTHERGLRACRRLPAIPRSHVRLQRALAAEAWSYRRQPTRMSSMKGGRVMRVLGWVLGPRDASRAVGSAAPRGAAAGVL